MSSRMRLLRWVAWLLAGVFAGLVVGFVIGLGRPRPRYALNHTLAGAKAAG